MNGYVAGGWGATILIVGVFAWRTLRRGRLLGRTLPSREKTWR